MIQLRIKIIDEEEQTTEWIIWKLYFKVPSKDQLEKDLESAYEYYENDEDIIWVDDWYLFLK